MMRFGKLVDLMLGSSGGEMNTICDIIIKIPSNDTPRIQEAHILIGHIICDTYNWSPSFGLSRFILFKLPTPLIYCK